jgi:hypothetical protein
MSRPRNVQFDNLDWLFKGIASVARIHVLLDRCSSLSSQMKVDVRKSDPSTRPLNRAAAYALRELATGD